MIHTVRYWRKITATNLEPLATSKTELRIECQAKDLEWCLGCIAAVKPESRLMASGLYNVCPFCGMATINP